MDALSNMRKAVASSIWGHSLLDLGSATSPKILYLKAFNVKGIEHAIHSDSED